MIAGPLREGYRGNIVQRSTYYSVLTSDEDLFLENSTYFWPKNYRSISSEDLFLEIT